MYRVCRGWYVARVRLLANGGGRDVCCTCAHEVQYDVLGFFLTLRCAYVLRDPDLRVRPLASGGRPAPPQRALHL